MKLITVKFTRLIKMINRHVYSAKIITGPFMNIIIITITTTTIIITTIMIITIMDKLKNVKNALNNQVIL